MSAYVLMCLYKFQCARVHACKVFVQMCSYVRGYLRVHALM